MIVDQWLTWFNAAEHVPGSDEVLDVVWKRYPSAVGLRSFARVELVSHYRSAPTLAYKQLHTRFRRTYLAYKGSATPESGPPQPPQGR